LKNRTTPLREIFEKIKKEDRSGISAIFSSISSKNRCGIFGFGTPK
jgi:hypothetical protein